MLDIKRFFRARVNSEASMDLPKSGQLVRHPCGQFRYISTIEDGMIYMRPSDRELREGLRAPSCSVDEFRKSQQSAAPARERVGIQQWFTGKLRAVTDQYSKISGVTEKGTTLLASSGSAAASVAQNVGEAFPVINTALVLPKLADLRKSEQPRWVKVTQGLAIVSGTASVTLLQGLPSFLLLLVSVFTPMLVNWVQKKKANPDSP